MPSGTLYTAGRVIVSRLYFSATRVLANYAMVLIKSSCRPGNWAMAESSVETLLVVNDMTEPAHTVLSAFVGRDSSSPSPMALLPQRPISIE